MRQLLLVLLLLPVLLYTGCGSNEQKNPAKAADVYTCPMHPEVISDKPGSCPVCFMDLVKKGSEEDAGTTTDKSLQLSGKKQILANVSVVKAHKGSLVKTISAYSYMDIPEDARRTIAARAGGRIEKLFVARTGDEIKEGQPLYEIYSTELIQVQTEFLNAVKAEQLNKNMTEPARKKLELLGLTQAQIQQIEKDRKILYTVVVYAPSGGTVLEKKVKQGEYINEGTALFEIASLKTLWNISEVFEQDAAVISPGAQVKLRLKAYPGEEFSGKVTLIYPVVNAQNRTVKVRSEFSNNGKLKPQAFGETVFSKNNGSGLLIPASAVQIQGSKATVWIKTGEKTFEARSVTLGLRYGEEYHIVSGLTEEDEVAVTGGFLIDSESQLQNPGSGK